MPARIQPTYEELKLRIQKRIIKGGMCIQPTYEELKRYSVPDVLDRKRYPAYL